MVCRAAFGAEVAPVDPNCGGAAQIFVGFAVFIDGARPDVAAAYPALSGEHRGGWGFMVLTNMLPNQGNGTYLFFMYAQDAKGTCRPAGDADDDVRERERDEAVRRDRYADAGRQSRRERAYVNFGWALTPLPKTIPIDGSTIPCWSMAWRCGTATYNNRRSDIATLFPGLNNTNGAVGFRVLDTTTLTNGLHTIAWDGRRQPGGGRREWEPVLHRVERRRAR